MTITCISFSPAIREYHSKGGDGLLGEEKSLFRLLELNHTAEDRQLVAQPSILAGALVKARITTAPS